MFEVREARAEDAPFIVECNCRMAMETEDLTLDPQTVRRGVGAVIEDPAKGRYFVVTHGGRTVGQLMITFEWSDWRNGNLWWVQSVYVVPEFRRRGAFTALYRHVERLAAGEQAAGLRLYVERDNLAAQQTYQRLGMHLSDYLVMKTDGRG